MIPRGEYRGDAGMHGTDAGMHVTDAGTRTARGAAACIRAWRLALVGLAASLLLATPAAAKIEKDQNDQIKVGFVSSESNESGTLDQIRMAGEDLMADGLIEFNYRDATEKVKFADNVQYFADAGYDLIVGVGDESAAVFKEEAQNYPRIHFAVIDSSKSVKGVKSLTFHKEESAYLTGAMAALATQKEERIHTYGAVFGAEDPEKEKLTQAYEDGVKAIDPFAVFIIKEVHDENDLEGCAELAETIAENGAMFVYAGADKKGNQGIFQIAAMTGFYTCGVNVDLAGNDNPWIISSQITQSYNAFTYLIEHLVNGKWTDEDESLGLEEDCVGLVYVTQNSVVPRADCLTSKDIKVLKNLSSKISLQ